MNEQRGATAARRTVHIGVYDGLADWEIGHVSAAIGSGQFHQRPDAFAIVTVGETTEPVTTMGGLRVVPDITLDAVRPEDSAMLVLPGADSWLEGGNKAFAAKAGELLAAGVPVAAICGATVGLAAAGLLDEVDHTSNAPQVLEMTGYAGADRYRDELAVADGNVITASAIAPVEFAREILAALDVLDAPTLASWVKLYGDHDPAGYFELVGQG
jgi:putative intracellular protease/amidase